MARRAAAPHGRRLGAARRAQLGELAVAGLEDALQAADAVAAVDRTLVERIDVVAAPELALELLGLLARAADRHPLAENEHPRHERHREQQHQHRLHHERCVDDQRPELEILRDRHAAILAVMYSVNTSPPLNPKNT